ncbi:NUDIX hydrolase [Brevibacillus sp. SIMBA_040]|uniref:NUDIX hydrolase n=1 Tax=unclassified Brevibacillus TaxID=2684853 RepID=UPI00397D31C4
MFIVNVEGAIFHEDRWLMIKRSTKEEHAGGTLSLVGGKADQEGNTSDILERTVRREIFEEVGVTVKDTLRYLYSSSFVPDDQCHVINVVFLCEYDNGDAHCKSPDEVEAVYWLNADEIMSHPKAPPWTRESIRRAEILRKQLGDNK